MEILITIKIYINFINHDNVKVTIQQKIRNQMRETAGRVNVPMFSFSYWEAISKLILN